MIRIYLGNLGSGKTACAVREIVNDRSGRVTYTNIVMNKVPNYSHIVPQNVILKKLEGKKTILDLNVKYWEKRLKPLHIIWDEIHLTANSRTSMSKANMVLSRFIAMARRITGFDERGYGHLTFIAQKDRTIDVNVRELANDICYHVANWILVCNDCGTRLSVNSEMQQVENCVKCNSWNIRKSNLLICRYKFNEWEDYYRWRVNESKVYYQKELITDIDKYFSYYDTMQISDVWDNYINS